MMASKPLRLLLQEIRLALNNNIEVMPPATGTTPVQTLPPPPEKFSLRQMPCLPRSKYTPATHVYLYVCAWGDEGAFEFLGLFLFILVHFAFLTLFSYLYCFYKGANKPPM